MSEKLAAEFLGTFWLVLGGCGSAVLAANFPGGGIGLAGVALAFGFTVLTGVYALGPISGGHFNPAVSFGLSAGTLPGLSTSALCDCASRGGHTRRRCAIPYRQRQAGLQPAGRLRFEWLWRSLARQVQLCSVSDHRSRHDIHVPDRDPWSHAQARASRLRRHSHRALPHAYPPHKHSGHEHFGEPGAKHWTGSLRRRMGARSTLALLGGADCRCNSLAGWVYQALFEKEREPAVTGR